MENCIFCKIVAQEIPSYKLYEDDNFMAFLDVFPRVKGHALVIPKKHYRWVYDVPEFGEYWEVAKKVSFSIKETLNARFISFVTMGEEVPHAHIHILPQKEDGIKGVRFSETLKLEKEELATLASKILKK